MAVSGVRSSWSLGFQGLLPAGEGGLQAREQAVDRGDEPPDLVFRVRHGQALREISLAYLAGGARYGIYGPEGGPRQQVRAADGQEEGRADAGHQHGSEDFEGLLGGLVGLTGLDHPPWPARRVHRHGVDVVRVVSREHGSPRGGLSRAGRLLPHGVSRFASRRKVRRPEDPAFFVPDDHGDPVKCELFDVLLAQVLSGLDGIGGRDRAAFGGVLDVVEQRAPAHEVECETQGEQDRADHQRDKEGQTPPDRQDGYPPFRA